MNKNNKSIYYGYPKDQDIIITYFGFIMKNNNDYYYSFYNICDIDTIIYKKDNILKEIFYSSFKEKTIKSNKIAVSYKYRHILDDKLSKTYDRINELLLNHKEDIIKQEYNVSLIRFIYKKSVYEINPYSFNLDKIAINNYNDLFVKYRNEMIKIIQDEIGCKHIFFDAKTVENDTEIS